MYIRRTNFSNIDEHSNEAKIQPSFKTLILQYLVQCNKKRKIYQTGKTPMPSLRSISCSLIPISI